MRKFQRLLIHVVVLVCGLASLGDTAMAKVSIITNDVELIPFVLLTEEFLENIENKNTVRSYRNDLRQFADFVADKRGIKLDKLLFSDINKKVIDEFRIFKNNSESSATAARRINCIKSLCDYAAEKFRTYNKAKEVRNLSFTPDKYKSLSDEQVSSLLRQCLKLGIRDKFIIHLLLDTGLRCSEASNLTLNNLSDDFKSLVNVIGKGSKKRNIPLTLNLRKLLADYMQYRFDFPTRPEFPMLVSKYSSKAKDAESFKMNVKTIYRIFKSACLKAQIPLHLAHPHTARHTFARITLAKLTKEVGIDKALLYTKKILGHSNLDTTMKYLTTDDVEIVAVFERVG